MYKVDGQPTNDYAEVHEIIINGSDGRGNSLSAIRRGATLVISDVVINTVAQFVVTEISFIGNPNGGQFWATIVRVAYGRNVGKIPDDSPCEIQVISPHQCITSADGFVGHLLLMTTVTCGITKSIRLFMCLIGMISKTTMVMLSGFLLAVLSSGGGVFVGEFPPTQNLEEGRLWFDTGRLELYVYYVEGGTVDGFLAPLWVLVYLLVKQSN